MKVKENMKTVYIVNDNGWKKITAAVGDNDNAITVMIALEQEMDLGFEPTVTSGDVTISLTKSDFDPLTVV